MIKRYYVLRDYFRDYIPCVIIHCAFTTLISMSGAFAPLPCAEKKRRPDAILSRWTGRKVPFPDKGGHAFMVLKCRGKDLPQEIPLC